MLYDGYPGFYDKEHGEVGKEAEMVAGTQKRPTLNDSCMPNSVGHSYAINILLLFISHLGSRKTSMSQLCKEDAKAQCFGLVKCTIKSFKMSSTHERLKTNVVF